MSKQGKKFDYKKIEYYADINNKHFVKRNDKAVFGEEEYKLEKIFNYTPEIVENTTLYITIGILSISILFASAYVSA